METKEISRLGVIIGLLLFISCDTQDHVLVSNTVAGEEVGIVVDAANASGNLNDLTFIDGSDLSVGNLQESGNRNEIYILSKEEGGRHTPFFNGYRPQFYFRTTDVTGVMTLPQGTEMVMPGDNVAVEAELITPIAMEKELRFAIREGGKTVGAGVVSEIVK